MKKKKIDAIMILCIITFCMVLSIFTHMIISLFSEKNPESTYVLEVTPQYHTKKEVKFLDKNGNIWSYKNEMHLMYYSGDEHLLVMSDNATPDDLRDDIIKKVY